jgi:hypothetical protein
MVAKETTDFGSKARKPHPQFTLRERPNPEGSQMTCLKAQDTASSLASCKITTKCM